MRKNKAPEPVYWAVTRQNLSDLVQAISDGNSIEVCDREGRTPLFYAVHNADTPIVNALIENGAVVNMQDRNGETPLHVAARKQCLDIVDILIRNGAKIDAQDVHGNTPLTRAVYYSRGSGDVIKSLLSAGADKTLKNNHGVSPEGLARMGANFDMNLLHFS